MQRPVPVLAAMAVALLVALPFSAAARTLYVTTHGGPVDLPEGRVVSYRLQEALDRAEPGDVVQLLGDGDKVAVYQTAEVFRLKRAGELARPITIRGQIRDGVHLTIVRGGCLEETRSRTSGEPPPRDQLPPCPSLGPPGVAIADVAPAPDGSAPHDPVFAEALDEPASKEPDDTFLEDLYAVSLPSDEDRVVPFAIEDPAHRAMCFMLTDVSWIVIEDLHFEQCWLPAILILGGSYITVRNNRITGSSYAVAAFPLNGKAPHHLLIERNHWIQDVFGPATETEACSRHPGRPACAGMMWHRVPFWVTHGGTWEPYNGALFGGKGILGSVIVRNNVLRNAFNGIRIEGMRCDDRAMCLYENEPCSLERPCNVNVEVYDNDFFFIRDNPVEIEGWAANWRIHGNDFVNSQSWLSMDGMRGGPVHIFGNTGTFDSIPGTACREGQWHDQKLYDYRGKPPVWIEPREEIEVGCRKNSTGKALKFGGTENEEPIYVFNNSWRLRGPLAAGGPVRRLRHWNNAIEFCIDHPRLCPASSAKAGGTASGAQPEAANIADQCEGGLAMLYARGQEFFDCANLPPRADGSTPPTFDFDLTNVGFPKELRDLNQERNGRPRPGEEPSRQLFVDEGEDFRLISPVTGCLVVPEDSPDQAARPSVARLACKPALTGAPEVGAIQSTGDRYQELPYSHWSRSGFSGYPEHPRPVAARWEPAAVGLNLIVEFTVPIELAVGVTAVLGGSSVPHPCTLRAERMLACPFPNLGAAPGPATDVHLTAGIVARAPTCAQKLPATDWGAHPQIRIGAPSGRTGRC